MPVILAIAGVFVGIGGPGAERIDRQVETLVHHDAKVERRELPTGQRPTLMHEGPRATAIVRGLGTEAVVVGWWNDPELDLVVYDRDGEVVDRISVDADGGALDRADLEQLRRTLVKDLKTMARGRHVVARPEPTPEPEPTPAPTPEPDPEIEIEPATDAEPDAPSGDSADAPPAVESDAEPTTDDIEEVEPHLGLRLAAGIGMEGRTFAAQPAGVIGYGSAPVPTMTLEGRVAPTPRLSLAVELERTVGMSTVLSGDTVASTMTRWQATAQLALGRRLHVTGGLGRRDVVIDTKMLERSPDAHYGYVIAGLGLTQPLGRRATVHADVAFEPVVSGAQPTMAALGDARRWALDGAAGLELALPHTVRVAVDVELQRFAWSWPAAGARGDGGASDLYPDVRFALGADL